MSEVQGLLVAVVIGVFVGKLFFGGKRKRRPGSRGDTWGSQAGDAYYGDTGRDEDDRDDDAGGDDGDWGGDDGGDDGSDD